MQDPDRDALLAATNALILASGGITFSPLQLCQFIHKASRFVFQDRFRYARAGKDEARHVQRMEFDVFKKLCDGFVNTNFDDDDFIAEDDRKAAQAVPSKPRSSY